MLRLNFKVVSFFSLTSKEPSFFSADTPFSPSLTKVLVDLAAFINSSRRDSIPTSVSLSLTASVLPATRWGRKIWTRYK